MANNVGSEDASLLDELTTIDGDGYGVSALSKDLLRAVGLDVIQFRRNQQVAYRVVERSRDVLNKINGLIAKIEEADPNAAEDWDNFDLYQGGIDSLEELLFGLADISGDEAQRYLFTLNDVVTCISDVEAWAENRKKLREAANKLTSDQTVVSIAGRDVELTEELSEAELQDDLAFHSDLVRNIKVHEIHRLKHLGEAKVILQNLEKTVSETNLQSLNDVNKSFVTYAVKFAYVVHGAMEIAVKPTTEVEWKVHLKSKLVWEAAHALALHIASGDETYGDFTTLQARYDEFLTILQNIPGVETPKSYRELIKLAHHIHRPYSSRALALVILCRALVALFNDNGNRVAKNVEPLEDVFEETISALRKAIETYRDVKIYDLEGYEKDEVIQAFNEVQERIKDCYSMFGAKDKWTDDAVKKLQAAEEKDKERMERMNARLTATSKKAAEADLEDISVEVTVKENGLTVGTPMSVKVKPSARLTFVRYQVSRNHPAENARKSAQDGHFENGNGDKISLDKSVQEVKGDAATCELVLELSPSASDLSPSDLASSVEGSEEATSTKSGA
ncbi:unnamed protein product [Peniophora sp. CBMAI 1063]|nr:unnamed protein product [Peniophora sp. CBMAI 1063]